MASKRLKPQGLTETKGIRPGKYSKTLNFNKISKNLNFKKWPQNSSNLKERQELKEYQENLINN